MEFSTEEYIDLTELEPKFFSKTKIEDAYSFCEKITTSHYENFPVASILIPQKERKYFFAIYAFARIADDLSDEIKTLNSESKIELLNNFYNNLELVFKGVTSNNPIFNALHQTIRLKHIEISLFKKLITAFIWDIKRENGNADFQAKSYDDLLSYCDNSANPIGELILTLFAENTQVNIELSNKICSALQLINFWQDLSLDLRNKRLFIPKQVLKNYNIEIATTEDLFQITDEDENQSALLDELYNYTEAMLLEGSQLVKKLRSYRLKLEIALIVESGFKMIKKLRKTGNIFEMRPKLVKFDLISIIANVILHQKILSR